MANHAFNVATVRITSKVYNVAITPSSTTSDPYVLTEGDTVTFTWTTAGGGAPSQLNFGNFSADIFTNTADVPLYSTGTSFTKTVKSGGTMPVDANCRVSTTGSGFKYWYVRRVSSIDTMPDTFTMGANIVNANPSQPFYSDVIIVSGLNTSVTAYANNGGLVSVNNGNYVTSATVVNGSKIRVKATSHPSYDNYRDTTLTIGTGTSTWRITNMGNPGDGQLIPLGITSGELKLSQIGDLFGREQYASATTLSEYLKAPTKTRVPDIAQNASVPTALPLKLTDFYGSATSFYILTYPANKHLSYDTSGQGGTFYLKWTVGVDWFLGFHKDIMNVTEFRYEVVERGPQFGLAISSSTPYGTWNKLNTDIQIGITVPAYVERRYGATITIYARHIKEPTKVVSAQMIGWFDFYGP